MTELEHIIPDKLFGDPVRVAGDPLLVRGELWWTLVPEDEEDARIWEFSTTTGRLILIDDGS